MKQGRKYIIKCYFSGKIEDIRTVLGVVLSNFDKELILVPFGWNIKSHKGKGICATTVMPEQDYYAFKRKWFFPTNVNYFCFAMFCKKCGVRFSYKLIYLNG